MSDPAAAGRRGKERESGGSERVSIMKDDMKVMIAFASVPESWGLLLPRLKSLTDGFRKLLGHGEGTHVDNDVIDLAILVEVHLIDRLKLLALELTLKD